MTAPGLEALASKELSALGLAPGKPEPGGVPFRADAAGVRRANLWLRTASRVLVRVAEFRATAFFELEKRAKAIDWAAFVAPGGAAAFRVTCKKSKLYHSDAVAERLAGALTARVRGAKIAGAGDDADEDDAASPGAQSDVIAAPQRNVIAAPQRNVTAGPQKNVVATRQKNVIARPGPGNLARSAALQRNVSAAPQRDVDVIAGPGPGNLARSAAPQLFVVRFFHDVCTLSVDSSGALLHRRGWRLATAKAPLRETLAAAVVLGSGWDARAPLEDPLCGSGTIAIEAALLARKLAPGLARAFAFEAWPGHAAAAWAAEQDAARALALPRAPGPIFASDADAGAVQATRANAARAGVVDDLTLTCRPLAALPPAPSPGVVATNPPYGLRVGERGELPALYAELGRTMRERRPGWRLALLSADRAFEARLGLGVSTAWQSVNGGLPVRLVVSGEIRSA